MKKFLLLVLVNFALATGLFAQISIEWSHIGDLSFEDDDIYKESGIEDWSDAYTLSINEYYFASDYDGNITVELEETGNVFRFGLTYNTDVNTPTFDYMFSVEDGDLLLIYENNSVVAEIGTLEGTEVLRIEKVSGVIYYWVDDALVYTSENEVNGDLYFASSIYGIGHTIRNYKYIPGAPSGCFLVDAGANRSICSGNSTQLNTITNDIIGCDPVSYSWSPSTGLSNASIGNPVASPTSTTTYTVTVTFPGSVVRTDAVTITVIPNVTSSVSIVSNASSNTACAGTMVTFTATPTNGGTSPIYQWKKNGSNVGTNSTTYQSNSLANGDVITCNLTSSLCVYTPTVSSNSVTMTINTVPPAMSVSVSASTGNTICASTSVTFSASITNSIGTISYQWLRNDTVVSTSSTYVSSGLSTGANVKCIVSTTTACVSPATSNTITMTVNPNQPALTISISTSRLTICPGESVTMTSSISGVSSGSANYSWKKNGVEVYNSSGTYVTTSLVDGDVIICSLTSSLPCHPQPTVSSNTLTFEVNPIAINAIDKEIPLNASTLIGGSASITGGVAPLTYSWSPSTFLSASNVVEPIASPTHTQTYTLTVTDALGCTATDNVKVTITPSNYSTLSATVNGEVHRTTDHKLQFYYFEEYVPQSSTLNYTIKQISNNTFVNSLPTLSVKKGTNTYTINISALTPGEYYLLEIRNAKQEKSYLKFYY